MDLKAEEVQKPEVVSLSPDLANSPKHLRALSILALAVSALAWFFGTGLHPIWWLVWLAPIPVLAVASRISGLNAFLLAAASWLIGELNLWNYVTRAMELPLPLIALFLGIPAIAFGFGVMFMRAFLRRGLLF